MRQQQRKPYFCSLLLGGGLTIPFVSCYGRPQSYSSFAVMCGPSRTARSLLCGALAIQFVCHYGGPSQTVCSQLCGFFLGGEPYSSLKLCWALTYPPSKLILTPPPPPPFFFSFHFLSFCNSCFLSWRDVFSGHLCKNANFIGIGSLKRVFLKSTLLSR